MTQILKIIIKIVLGLFALGMTLGIGMSIIVPLVLSNPGQQLPSFYFLRIIGITFIDIILIWIILRF